MSEQRTEQEWARLVEQRAQEIELTAEAEYAAAGDEAVWQLWMDDKAWEPWRSAPQRHEQLGTRLGF